MSRDTTILMGITAAITANAAMAQSVVLTEKNGRPLIVGGATLGGTETVPLAPADIAAEFVRICLPDPASAGARTAGSSLGLSLSPVQFSAIGKTPEATVQAWAGSGSALYLWFGEDGGLKGREIAIESRAYVTTGPYGSFKAAGTQCNLVVSVPDFTSVRDLTAALERQLGQAPTKLVSKNTFADGFWTLPNNIRVNFTSPTTRTGPQPVHLSVQALTKEAR